MKTIRILPILFVLAGCASTNRASFRDPEYSHRDFTKVAVFAVDMNPTYSRSLEREVCDKLAPAQCVSAQKLLPPSKADSPRDIAQSLSQANVDGILIVMLGDDQTAAGYLANIVSGSAPTSSAQSRIASLYTNIAMWNASSLAATAPSAAPVPLYTYERAAHAVVGLIDRTSGKTAWGGQLNVLGQGEVSVSDNDFIGAVTNELAAQLRDNRLIKIPPPPTGR